MIGALYLIAFVLPLLAAVAAVVLAHSEHQSWITHQCLMLSGVLGLAATSAFFVNLSATTSALVPIFFGAVLTFAVTPLSAFFLGVVFLGVLLTSWYALGYLPFYRLTYSLPWLDAATGLFIFGMIATLMAGQPLTFLLAWEIMSVSAYFLVIADNTHESHAAGLKYLVMAQIGFLCLLAGFFLLGGVGVFASWSAVATQAQTLPAGTRTAAFLLLLVGFGSKAGLVPLHQWLPAAHPQAPSHSSALLSGVMLKVALYGFILSTTLFSAIPFSWALLVVFIGLLSAFFGVLHAVVESEMKRMLAWSSIENMGLLFMGVGLVLVLRALPATASSVALAAGVTGFIALHTVNHSLFKGGLFMSVGAVVATTHTRDLDRLGGLANKWPFFSGVFLVLVLAAAALPPLGTFFGEWLLLQPLAAAFASASPFEAFGAALLLAAVALVSGLAIFAFVKLFSVAFLGRARSVAVEKAPPMPRALTFPPMVSAGLLFLSGLLLFPFATRQPIRVAHLFADVSVTVGASLNAWSTIGVFLAAVTLAYGIRRVLFTRGIRVTDTWDCGTTLTPRMQYTATGFAAPIRFFFRSFVLSRKEFVSEPVVATNPWISHKKLRWATDSFWEAWLYRPMSRALFLLSDSASRIQNGVVQFYLLLVLVALVAAILFAL